MQKMNHLEAWDHFFTHVYQKEILGVRGAATDVQRMKIRNAQRDRLGKRLIKGRPVALSADRVQEILNEFAPGRYLVTPAVFEFVG